MKERLLTRMIKIYGYEHEAVYQFIEIMDKLDENILEIIVKSHEGIKNS